MHLRPLMTVSWAYRMDYLFRFERVFVALSNNMACLTCFCIVALTWAWATWHTVVLMKRILVAANLSSMRTTSKARKQVVPSKCLMASKWSKWWSRIGGAWCSVYTYDTCWGESISISVAKFQVSQQVSPSSIAYRRFLGSIQHSLLRSWRLLKCSLAIRMGRSTGELADLTGDPNDYPFWLWSSSRSFLGGQ